MPLATQEDVEERLGRDLTEAEADRIEVMLDDASAIVVGYCRQDFETPVPSTVAGVVAKMIVRSLGASANAAFTVSETVGPSTVRYSDAAASGDFWLTAADKLALRPHRLGGGMTSVGLVGERYDPASEG